jgi:hypothetical protein
MIFIDNKYTKWYFSIIQNAQLRELPDYIYKEKHHIIPRSIGGNNDSSNLVNLTAREHFVCHWLLTKMVDGDLKSPMVYALFVMKAGHNKQYRYTTKITGRVYANLKEVRSVLVSKQLTGRPVSQETKNKIRDSQKGVPRKPHTEETRAKMREAHKHRKPDSNETRLKKSLAKKGKPSPLLGRPLSEEVKSKLRKPKAPRSEEHKKKLGEAVRQAAILRRAQYVHMEGN